MARNVSTIQATEIPAIADTPAERDNEITVDTILAAAGQSPEDVRWKCSVLRVDKNTMQESSLFNVTPDELDALPDRLRDERGSGHYRVRVYRKAGEERQVLFKTYDLRVEADQKPAQAKTEMSAVLEAFSRMSERMETLITRIVQPLPMPVASPVADPISAVTQIVAAMKGLNEMMGPPRNPTMDVANAMMKGFEIASAIASKSAELGPREAGETNWLDIIKEFLKSGGLAAMVQNPGGQPPPAIPPRVAPPAQVQPPPSQVPPIRPQTQSNEQQIVANIRAGILSLIPNAARGSNPELYAEWILDNWPREVTMGVLQQPNAMALLQQLVPEAAPYAPWFEKAIAAMREMVNDGGATAPGTQPNASPDISPVQPFRDTGWSGGSESDFEADERTN